MNKKEISEIKKQLSPEHCAITRISGCYVNADKEKVTEFTEAFLSLPEEDMYKYFEILRKVLSGTLRKNLMEIEFPLAEEGQDGKQTFLYSLVRDRICSEEKLSDYYDRVITCCPLSENYLILIIHAAYDVPGRANDQLEMFDASDETYHFLISCVCPVALSKPGLSYDAGENRFHERIRDWVVGMPELGFLFPSFTDRRSDIHQVLYYSRNAADLHADYLDGMFGCHPMFNAPQEKETFTSLVEETLGEECDYDIVRELHQQLHEYTQEHKDSPDPVTLGPGDVKNLLSQSGASSETLDTFEDHFTRSAGEHTEFAAANISSSKHFEVRTADVLIQVSPDRADLVERRTIDGRACLVIPITDEVVVNGIRVKNKPVSDYQQ